MAIKYSEILEKVLSPDEIRDANKSVFPTSYRPSIYRFSASTHTRARAYLRHKDVSNEDWKEFHRSVESKINSTPRVEKKNGDYLFFSNSKNYGYVANVNHDKRTVHVISVLPKGRSNVMPGTSKVLMEYFI